MSLQLIGKDIEEAIEAETSGDLQKAYLTLGKAEPGGSLTQAGLPGDRLGDGALCAGSFHRIVWEQHLQAALGKAGNEGDTV